MYGLNEEIIGIFLTVLKFNMYLYEVRIILGIRDGFSMCAVQRF